MGRRPGKQEQQIKKSSENEKKSVIFKRRKQGIMKKAMELSTLCDVPVLVIIRSPNGDLEVWPQDPSQVRAILEKYGQKNPRQNPEGIEVKERDLMTNDGLSAHEEQLLPGENICSTTGGVQHDVGLAMMVPINDRQLHCPRAEIVENNNANAINDHDLVFGWEQSLTRLGFNLDDFQPQPLHSHDHMDFTPDPYFGNMDFTPDPYFGNIWNGGDLDFGADVPDLLLGCTFPSPK